MTYLNDLSKVNRLLLEAELVPAQGARFQPTGFPNLGAATFTRPNGEDMLLLESAQSMANRLEMVCWDEVNKDLVPELKGIPYVRVLDKESNLVTNSILESHRINSPYILEGKDKSFVDTLIQETDAVAEAAVDISRLVKVVLKYDPNSVLHGVFIAKKELGGGRLRLQRLLSSFIEARNVRPVESGGVKMDRVNPKGDTKQGFGHVPFHRTEFTAESITAYFSLDLAALRSYNLGNDAEELMINLALWKIRRLLSNGLRLRTACDLDVKDIVVTRPSNFSLPTEEELTQAVKQGIDKCTDLFANPLVTDVTWK